MQPTPTHKIHHTSSVSLMQTGQKMIEVHSETGPPLLET